MLFTLPLKYISLLVKNQYSRCHIQMPKEKKDFTIYSTAVIILWGNMLMPALIPISLYFGPGNPVPQLITTLVMAALFLYALAAVLYATDIHYFDKIKKEAQSMTLEEHKQLTKTTGMRCLAYYMLPIVISGLIFFVIQKTAGA